MPHLARRLALPLAVVALAVGGLGFARASAAAFDAFARAPLVPSAEPALLGPIDALGRNGWRCLPERAAQALRASEADLPPADAPEGGP